MFARPGEIISFLKEKKYLTQNMNGADFGCGSGYFSVLLAQTVLPSGTIYAIDIQDEVLKEASEFANNLGIKNIRFLKQNLEITTGLAISPLDFVFISQVLYQSKEPEKILKNAYQVLKTNGFLIIFEPQKNNFLFQNQEVYPQEKIEEICSQLGFKLIDHKNYPGYFLLIFQK